MKKLEEFKVNNEIIAEYFYVAKSNGDYKYYERISNEYFDNIRSFTINIEEKIKEMFKKNPDVYNLIEKIIKIEKQISLYNEHYTVSEYLLSKAKTFEKIKDRDILRHLKNYGFNWKEKLENLNKFEKERLSSINMILSQEIRELSDNYGCPLSLEYLDDLVEDIVLHQKSKKMIQKIYSSSYKNLVDDRTIEIFKKFVEKNIPLSIIRDNYAKKLARYKNADDANNALSNYLKEVTGWNKNFYKEKIKKLGGTIINENENEMLIDVHSYEQAKEIGSGQWCITYDKEYYIDYKEKNNFIFINLDFEKDPDDPFSMVGIVFAEEGFIEDGYLRNDKQINFIKDKFFLEKIKNKVDKNYIIENRIKNFKDILKELKSKQKKSYIEEYFLHKDDYFYKDMQNINLINDLMVNRDYFNTILTNESVIIKNVIKNTKREDDNPESILKEKYYRNVVKNILESSEKIGTVERDENLSPLILNELIEIKDFELIKIFTKKVESAVLVSLLNFDVWDLMEEENQENFFSILDEYKKNKKGLSSLPFLCNIIHHCYKVKEKYIEDDRVDNFIRKIFEYNDNKIPIVKVLKELNKKDSKYNKETIESVIFLALEKINKEKLKSDLMCFNLDDFNNVNIDIIKNIKRKIKDKNNLIVIK